MSKLRKGINFLLLVSWEYVKGVESSQFMSERSQIYKLSIELDSSHTSNFNFPFYFYLQLHNLVGYETYFHRAQTKRRKKKQKI